MRFFQESSAKCIAKLASQQKYYSYISRYLQKDHVLLKKMEHLFLITLIAIALQTTQMSEK